MIRRLFTLASAVSLLLCAGAAVLWLDSRNAKEELFYSHWREGGGTSKLWNAGVGACRGRVWVEFTSADLYAPSSVSLFRIMSPPGFHREKSRANGLFEMMIEERWFRAEAVTNANSHARVTTADAMAPAWVVVAVTLLLPVAWRLAYRRARRIARSGRCRQCGYDLRATPHRCPECGRPTL